MERVIGSNNKQPNYYQLACRLSVQNGGLKLLDQRASNALSPRGLSRIAQVPKKPRNKSANRIGGYQRPTTIYQKLEESSISETEVAIGKPQTAITLPLNQSEIVSKTQSSIKQYTVIILIYIIRKE